MLAKELVYSILDLLKGLSDDFTYTEEDVLFLCKKYRSFLIKKEQEKNRNVSGLSEEFESQQICIDLEKVPAIDGMPCTGGYYLRSVQEIPRILEGSQPKVYPTDYYQGAHINYVTRDRMRYVGTNKYLQNIIYVSLGPDLHLYCNSGNAQFLHLKKLRMSAVFEDFDAAADYLCDDNGAPQSCDVLDMAFPIRDYLVPTLIELVLKELSTVKYQPKDTKNNAADDAANNTGK